MTENKPKQVIERVGQQVGQTWTKVQPQLQILLLKLVKSLLPVLHNLQTKLTPSNLIATDGETPKAANDISSNATLNTVFKTGRTISSKAIAALIVALTKLQQTLQGHEIAVDGSGEAAALLNVSTEPDSQLAAQVKQEFGVA